MSQYPGTLTLPLKSVTLEDGRTVSVNCAALLTVRASGSTSKGTLWAGGLMQKFTSTSTASALAVGWPSILVTAVGSATVEAGAMYVGTGMMQYPYTEGPYTAIQLSVSESGINNQPLLVTESLAAVVAAYNVAAAVVAPDTTESVTATGATQAAAAATTASNIRIIGGAANTGIILPAATLGANRFIYNATDTLKFYYPAIGGFIDDGLVNVGFTLGAGEGAELTCTLAGKWDLDQNKNRKYFSAAGTTQGAGIKIPTGTEEAVIATTSFGNTAIVLPAAKVGKELVLRNIATLTARVFPASGEIINANPANQVMFLQVGYTVSFICTTAGTWTEMISQIETLATNKIVPIAPSGTQTIEDGSGNVRVTLSSANVEIGLGLVVYEIAAAADVSGATQLDSNLFNINSVPTALDSVTLTGNSNLVVVKNTGALIAKIFCPLGNTMNGTLNGFLYINPGAVLLIARTADTTDWGATILNVGTQSGTAASGANPSTPILSSAVVCTVCAVAADRFAIIAGQTPYFFVLKNAGANSTTIEAPAGGSIDTAAVAAAACRIYMSNNGLDYVSVASIL